MIEHVLFFSLLHCLQVGVGRALRRQEVAQLVDLEHQTPGRVGQALGEVLPPSQVSLVLILALSGIFGNFELNFGAFSRV